MDSYFIDSPDMMRICKYTQAFMLNKHIQMPQSDLVFEQHTACEIFPLANSTENTTLEDQGVNERIILK
jgi:hypothetical protein